MEFAFEFDKELLTTYAIEYGINITTAILIFIVGKLVAKVVTNIAGKAMTKARIDKTLVSFASNIIYGLLIAFVVIAALSRLGIQTTSLAAILAAAGLAIGLSLKDSLSNFSAGVLIILFRPFKIGHFVEVSGVAGTVKDINIFTTTIKTGDNKTIIVPNSAVTSGNVINYHDEKTRRVDMIFGIGYGDDLKKAKNLLMKIVTDEPRVLKDPAPLVAVNDLGASSVNFKVRPWVKTEDYWDVLADITEQVKLQFDANGISIPFPQQDVHMHTVVEKPKKKETKKN